MAVWIPLHKKRRQQFCDCRYFSLDYFCDNREYLSIEATKKPLADLAKMERTMRATAQFDTAKHSISVDYDRKLIGIRYAKHAEHVRAFYMRKRDEFSQMRHVVGSDRSYDPIMSDA